MSAPQSDEAIPDPVIIGARMKEARTVILKWKIERMATFLDISADTVKRYEDGDSDPRALEVWRVAQEAKQPLGWFVREPQSLLEAETALVSLAVRANAQLSAVTTLLAALQEELGVAIGRERLAQLQTKAPKHTPRTEAAER